MGKLSKKEEMFIILVAVLMVPAMPFVWLYKQIKGMFETHPNDPDNPDYRDQGQDDISPPKPE